MIQKECLKGIVSVKGRGFQIMLLYNLVHSVHQLLHKWRMEQLGLETRPPLLLLSFLPMTGYQGLIPMAITLTLEFSHQCLFVCSECAFLKHYTVH